MKINGLSSAERLREGQLWKLNRRYIYIVGLLESSIQFKLMDSPNETMQRTLNERHRHAVALSVI